MYSIFRISLTKIPSIFKAFQLTAGIGVGELALAISRRERRLQRQQQQQIRLKQQRHSIAVINIGCMESMLINQ